MRIEATRSAESECRAAAEASAKNRAAADVRPADPTRLNAAERASESGDSTRRRPASGSELRDLASRLESIANTHGTKVSLAIDSASDIVVCRVIDPTTDEVIRQIPAEDALQDARDAHALERRFFDAV